MNIFILDSDIKLNAQYHNDKHVVKMILEYCQLLSSYCHIHNIASEGMYKLTHKNHPSCKWLCESGDNFNYLLSLTEALLDEYTYRYGKIHASARLIPMFKSVQSKLPESKGKLTPFAIVVSEDVKGCNDAIQAYRKLYMTSKRHLCTWKNRNVPSWYM